MNPFYIGLSRAIGSRKVGTARRRAGFAAAPTLQAPAGEGALVKGTQQFSKPVADPAVIETGRRSLFSEQTPLHNNAVTILIENLNATHEADVVIFPGRYATEFAARTLADGTKATTNLAGTADINVRTTVQYGVRSGQASLAAFKEYIDRGAVGIAATRLQFTTKQQRAYMLQFERRSMFGDETLDQIFPEVYYDAKQYDDLTIQSDLGYALDPNTIVSYRLRASEKVVLMLWVNGIYDPARIMTDFVRRKGGSSLL